MAKKAVATFKKGDGRTYSKVIKMVKSPKTGAYIFQEEMIPNEAVKECYVLPRTTILTQALRLIILDCIDD